MRTSTWIAATFAGFVALAMAQAADDYPARPVRIIVGFGPGATIDVTARVLTPKLGQAFNQQFVVENKTGAGSNLAADFVAHAPKDGYTLLVGTIANTINAAMGQKLNFDFEKDFAPIALVATVPNILVVHPSIGVKSVDDLIKLARAKPDELSYGSAGRQQCAASLRRAVQVHDRHQDGARALSGLEPGGRRPAHRPRAGDVLARLDGCCRMCRKES